MTHIVDMVRKKTAPFYSEAQTDQNMQFGADYDNYMNQKIACNIHQ